MLTNNVGFTTICSLRLNYTTLILYLTCCWIFRGSFHIPLAYHLDVNEKPSSICLHGNTIAEGLPAQTVVGQVIVEDPDHTSTRDACRNKTSDARGTRLNFGCKIESESDKRYFELSSDLTLRTKMIFIMETNNVYNVELTCTDKNAPLHTVTRSVEVTITGTFFHSLCALLVKKQMCHFWHECLRILFRIRDFPKKELLLHY